MKNYLLNLKKSKNIPAAQRLFDTYNSIFSKYFTINIYGNVLDVGSGSGNFVDVLKKNQINAVGIDIDEINFEKDKFPFDDNEFDFIFANAVIEHISNPENLLKEINRIIKDDGYFLLSTPNWRMCYKTFYRDPTHKQPYDVESIRSLLKIFGFETLFLNPNFINKPLWLFDFPFKWQLTFITKSMLIIAKKNSL
jgi:2-polyprenyl-3-methyl-5-hydroxy-6-metoxy-1,4-benzoquinol methylase